MTFRLAFLLATAVTAFAAPALAQDGPAMAPPPGVAGGWAGQWTGGAHPVGPGAPYYQSGVPMMPPPPPGYGPGPMGGPETSYPGYPGYIMPPVVWVRVPIMREPTTYREEVIEEDAYVDAPPRPARRAVPRRAIPKRALRPSK